MCIHAPRNSLKESETLNKDIILCPSGYIYHDSCKQCLLGCENRVETVAVFLEEKVLINNCLKTNFVELRVPLFNMAVTILGECPREALMNRWK